MNLLINNSKNKKCKTCKNNIKKHVKHAKNTYTKLKISTIDKSLLKLFNKQPNLFPEYVIYRQNHTLFELSKNISQKINSQIIKYKSKKSLCFVEFLGADCARQIFLQQEVDVFKYAFNTYGYNSLNKKELKIFPYVLSNYIFVAIIKVMKLLNRYAAEIEYGALCKNKLPTNLSLANIYGVVKYNPNYALIAQNLNVNYKKCVFDFVNKLSNIELKLQICVKYLKYLSSKYNL